jgi:hypothetical protein
MKNNKLEKKFDIEAAKKDKGILKATANQVIKDFAMLGMEVHFPLEVENTYPELFTQLSQHLEGLLESDHDKLMNLLYQIDVSDKLIKTRYSQHDSAPDILADKILQRELLKVLTRLYFRETRGK